MAAPTNVVVESNSSTQAAVTWTYTGLNAIAVYRAPHGGAFTEITDSSTRPVPGTTTYYDNTAVAGTFYDYKLSDDLGSTFSSIVSVVIQTCGSTSGSTQQTTGTALPQFTTQQDINPETLQHMSQILEAAVNSGKISGECVVCSSNGALVFNCSDGCKDFLTVLTEDINSISSIGCFNDGTIRMIVPTSTPRKVKGWPAGSGLQQTPTGNQGVVGPVEIVVQRKCECSEADIIFFMNTGVPCACDFNANGSKPVKHSPASTSGSSGSVGGGGPTAGGCTPSTGLTIITTKMDGSANPKHSMGCKDANPGIKLQSCGGTPPYSWSFTGSINFVGSSTGRATALPPTNNGAAVAGNAYQITGYDCNACFTAAGTCPSPAVNKKIYYDCNDKVVICGDSGTGDICAPAVPLASSITCKNGACAAGQPVCSVPVCPDAGMGDLVAVVCDARTAPMIAAGCNPCGLIQTGAGTTITVTDSAGVSTTIVVTS